MLSALLRFEPASAGAFGLWLGPDRSSPPVRYCTLLALWDRYLEPTIPLNLRRFCRLPGISCAALCFRIVLAQVSKLWGDTTEHALKHMQKVFCVQHLGAY